MLRTLYDWPASLIPSKGIARFVSTVEEGRVSRRVFENDAAIPGGRVQMSMEFAYWQRTVDIEAVSWLTSKLRGNIFRVPIPPSVQVARNADLGLASTDYLAGIPFDGDVFFDEGVGFDFEPTLDTIGTALEGTTSVVIDETRWPGLLRYGKWIGIGFGAYHIADLDRSGSTVTVEIEPPLRRDVAAGEFVSLRPSLICQARDASSFASMFEPADLIQPGSLVLTEVIDERFL
ncbi:hypothetical protein GCM10007908_03750 [Rhizobium albus]|nr:hypothetical protein GCM10007908_03750 [Rhizobium albus]